MDLPSQEVEIPMPLNSAYGGALVHGHVTNMIHHHNQHDHDHDHAANAHDHPSSPNQFQAPTSNGPPMSSMAQNHDHHNHLHHQHSKKHQQQIRYRECLKNHAASMGGNATDGCGEFMPSGEEGSIEYLTCSACNCHRNFHRKEVAGEISSFPPLMYDYNNYHHGSSQQQQLMINSRGRKVINLGHHKNILYTGNDGGGGGPRSVPIFPYNMGSLLISSDQSDDQEELGGAGVAASGGVACRALPPPPSAAHNQNHQNQYYLHHHNQMMKKRFRTKFTPEQKEKMLSFAEKVGWKIQKQEESVVQEFCQEIGVKRRVLKVWMHNNKHSLAKKNSDISNA